MCISESFLGERVTGQILAGFHLFLLNLRYFFQIFLVFLFCLTAQTSCVLPPSKIDASVIPQKELELISHINRGQSYARSGRPDLAEVEFRLAILLSPQRDSLYNDLAYSLQNQDRIDEARKYYRKALQLNPSNIAARENLAQTLYRSGELDSSLLMYEELLTFLSPSAPSFGATVPPLALVEPPPGVAIEDITRAFRNLSIVYYKLGYLDDAICYSQLALDRGVNLNENGRHARLLFSLDFNQRALSALKTAISVRQASEIPARVLLDYGIGLFVVGNEQLAKSALMRVVTSAGVSFADKKTARLLLLHIADSEKNEKEAEFVFSALLEDDTTFCNEPTIQHEAHWPTRLHEAFDLIQQQIAVRCSDEG